MSLVVRLGTRLALAVFAVVASVTSGACRRATPGVDREAPVAKALPPVETSTSASAKPGAPVLVSPVEAWLLRLEPDAVLVQDESGVARAPLAGGEPARVASFSGMFATPDPAGVFWIDWDLGATTKPQLMRTSAGVATKLAEVKALPRGIVVDDVDVYAATAGPVGSDFPGDGAIVAVAKGGGPSRTLVTGRPIVGELALDREHVYWLETTGDDAEVRRVSKKGGASSSVVRVPGAYALAVAGGEVLVAADALYTAPASGGAPARVPGTESVVDAAGDDDGIAWATGDEVWIRSRSGAARRLAGGQDKVKEIALSRAHVAWSCASGVYVAPR